MKICNKCGCELVINRNWSIGSKRANHNTCIECFKLYRVKNKEKIKAYRLKYREKYKLYDEIKQDWVKAFKECQGCTLCGYNKCGDVLAYHHVEPKEKTMRISAYNIYHGHKETHNELLKCMLLCSNCHKEIHYLMKHQIIKD